MHLKRNLTDTHRSAPSGFTLIELLSVIAIIGILAVLLMTTFARVRMTARNTQSMSNLRQIAMSALSYANENKGWLPDDGNGNPSYMGTTGKPGTVPWYNALPPYFGERTIADRYSTDDLPTYDERSVMVCPRAIETTKRSTAYAWRSYGPSWLIDGTSGSVQTRMQTVREPGKAVLFSELTFHTVYDGKSPTSDSVTNANPRYLAQADSTRHEDSAFVAFFDGAVRRYSAEELQTQYDERALATADVRWNPQL